MRFVAAIVTAIITLAAHPALAACVLDPAQAVSKVPYFGSRMIVADSGSESGILTYQHVDDPRMIASFTMANADPVGMVSRSEHVDQLDAYATSHVQKAQSNGRWAQRAVFPYDPVAWRVVEETNVESVGEATVGHMEIRLTPQCILVADFISPASVNLKTRWVQMAQEIANIREAAHVLVIPETWDREDTTPTGITAIVGGFLSPLVVVGLIYLLLGHLRRLDPPGLPTRIVLASSAAVAFGAAAYQYTAYMAAFDDGKYIDNALLLGFAGLAALAGALLAQQAALMGLVAACITGFALSVASFLGWTPDVNIGIAVGLSMMFMGVFGFYAWSRGSGTAKPAP